MGTKNLINLKKLFLVLVLIICITATNAQEKPDREKIESLKVAYITQKLSLTETESQNFWPVYNSYKKERKELLPKKNKDVEPDKRKKPIYSDMSDAEINDFISKKFQSEEDLIALKKRYFEKFKTILPIKKVVALYEAEKGFRKEILKKLKEQR